MGEVRAQGVRCMCTSAEAPRARLVVSAMSGGRDGSRAGAMPTVAGATFELDRFAWAAPDRLELAGRFAGIGDAPGDAILVVRGLDWVQRLPAVPGTEPPDESGRWRAAFAWLEAPAAFDGATLELGDELIVELPAPRSRRRPFHHELLEVRRHDGAAVAEPGAGRAGRRGRGRGRGRARRPRTS